MRAGMTVATTRVAGILGGVAQIERYSPRFQRCPAAFGIGQQMASRTYAWGKDEQASQR